MSALSPVQAAAMAAERRMHDDLWCGSVCQEITRTDGLEALEGSTSDIPKNVLVNSWNGSSRSSLSVSTSSQSAVEGNEKDNLMWGCNICTLLNKPLAPVCEACGTQKHVDSSSSFKIWTCKFCTLENITKLDKCFGCDQWRYSYGPPVSARAPNYGT